MCRYVYLSMYMCMCKYTRIHICIYGAMSLTVLMQRVDRYGRHGRARRYARYGRTRRHARYATSLDNPSQSVCCSMNMSTGHVCRVLRVACCVKCVACTHVAPRM